MSKTGSTSTATFSIRSRASEFYGPRPDSPVRQVGHRDSAQSLLGGRPRSDESLAPRSRSEARPEEALTA